MIDGWGSLLTSFMSPTASTTTWTNVALWQPVHHVDREQEALATIRFAEEMIHGDPSTAADAKGITPPECSYPSDVDRDRGGALDEAPIMQQALRRSKTTIEWHEGA